MTDQEQTFPRPWATATDRTSHAWTFRVTMAQAIQLRTRRKVDLLATDAAKTAAQVAADPLALAEIAFDISHAERQSLGLGEESDFLARWDGDCWLDLIDATVEALIDFFPPSRRQALLAIWRRQKAAENRVLQKMTERATSDGTLAMLDRQADQALQEFERKISELGTIRS